MLKALGIVLFLWTYVVSTRSIATKDTACSDLKGDVKYAVDSKVIDAGALNITDVNGSNNFTFCRVFGRMPYSKNDTINFEVWLPTSSKYNDRYLSVGNGGFAGVIDYVTMLENLNAGYAVGGCDSGHLESDNGPSKPGAYVPFLNSQAQTKAWIRDSIATFSTLAKDIATSYYKCPPKKMYYYGCSTGGAQGFALAKYYPSLFDGIFAGSAGNWYTHLILSFLWNGVQADKPGAMVSQDLLSLARDAAIAQCDTLDGVKDGVIEDPTKCGFDVKSLLCKDGQNPVANNKTVCINETQLQTFKAIYDGPGKDVYPGFSKGSESEWLLQELYLYTAYAVPILQNLVFKDLSYDYTKFDFGRDVKIVDEVAGPLITATSPRLDDFKERGGKLIATQGWADPFNAPFWPIDQHDQARAIYGEKQLNDFWRLFMVPGGGHCGGATTYPHVPGTWHTLEALVQWVETGKAPQYVLATKPADGSNRTRRLCPYPKKAVHKSGSMDDYASYDCA